MLTLSQPYYKCAEDFPKVFARKLQQQQVLPVFYRKFKHCETQWKWDPPTT